MAKHVRTRLQDLWTICKPYLSPLLLLAIFIFLGFAFHDHWYEVKAIRIAPVGWGYLAIATGITLLAHVWIGWVWGWILGELGQPVNRIWAVQAYLITNIAKYLPSNVMHLYGRAIAASQIGVPLSTASLSVLLDTLLMAAAGLIFGLFSLPKGGLWAAGLGLLGILIAIHPRILPVVLQKLAQQLNKTLKRESVTTLRMIRYPVGPLLGEMGFVVLRGLSFVLTLMALTPVQPALIPLLISIFSIGWVLGFMTPGAPGGIGIFEVTVVTLLSQHALFHQETVFSMSVALSAVALHRLLSTLAEAMGAGLATLDQKWPLGGTPPEPRQQ